MAKEKTSFRLSAEAMTLIRELAGKLGISQASVIEMAVRLLADEPSVSRRRKKEDS